MPRHSFRFPTHIRNTVKNHVERAVHSVDTRHFKQEPAYCAALASQLKGIVYEGTDGRVEFLPTVVSDRGPGAAEKWSGADLAITADITRPGLAVRKAILIQAKSGSLSQMPAGQLEDLRGQIKKMRKLTRSPKVMDIGRANGHGNPGIYSGKAIVRGDQPTRYGLAEYMVQRILTTLDGDTRPDFVEGVQDSDLTQLKVLAHLVK